MNADARPARLVALYVPSGYYLESYLFNRRMRKRSESK